MTCNGADRPYRCMHCLETYPKSQMPEKDELLYEQLILAVKSKYGVKRTNDLLSKSCTLKALRDDVECRRNQLHILLNMANRFLGHYTISMTVMETSSMADQLSKIMEYIDKNGDKNINTAKESYQKTISLPYDPKGLAMKYIKLSEELQLEITKAEHHSLFPDMYALEKKWVDQMNKEENAQEAVNHSSSKIYPLFKAVEQDLIRQFDDPDRALRIKIGIIGYISAGKSTLINRMLGVKSPDEEGAVFISANKSTYFPGQFDLKKPLIDPVSGKKTFVTLVDIQGDDENKKDSSSQIFSGNYLDEIRKADCDIYIVVFEKLLSDEQIEWIKYIKGTLNRCCVLVRSKVDIEFLEKFYKKFGQFYGEMDKKTRIKLGKSIIEELRQESSFVISNEDQTNNTVISKGENKYCHDFFSSRANSSGKNDVIKGATFLVCCNYWPSNSDAKKLQEDESFDFDNIHNILAQYSPPISRYRIPRLGTRALARMINTYFRRDYIINVLKFEIGTGFASIIPFLDQLPRYLARDSIREAYGINDDFHNYLKSLDLTVYQYKLQTSVFEKSVKLNDKQKLSSYDSEALAKAGKAVGTGLIVAGVSVLDDIVRAVPTTTTLLSDVGRAVFTGTTLGIGAGITLGVSVWSAYETGKHIFSYGNQLCDDMIMISEAFILEIMERNLSSSMTTQITQLQIQ